MSQFSWIILDDKGKHKVGLYHGKTGHLMVYLNTSIIIIDFHVLQSKTYSFFLGEELYELTVKRAGHQWAYGLKSNEKVNTPLNQARKKHKQVYVVQGFALLLLVILFWITLFMLLT